jgi:hypothetical protein
MGRRCITTTGMGKETIDNIIMSGVATYNNWVEHPYNASERNKDNKMVPYLKPHFIYINYAKSVYYVGSEKVPIYHLVYWNSFETQFMTKREFIEDDLFNYMETESQ